MTVETAKHVVTPSMAEASRGMVFRQAPAFTLKATDGAEYSLGELIHEGPLLLTFIKIGCPCSEAAQPFFNRLRAAYPHADPRRDRWRPWSGQPVGQERFA